MDKNERYLASFKGSLNHLFLVSRKNAKTSGKAFTISRDDILELYKKQKGKCALTSVLLYPLKSGWPSISLDRINARRGYVLGNVQLVCWRANESKSWMNNRDFIDMCSAIAKTHRPKRRRKKNYSYAKNTTH